MTDMKIEFNREKEQIVNYWDKIKDQLKTLAIFWITNSRNKVLREAKTTLDESAEACLEAFCMSLNKLHIEFRRRLSSYGFFSSLTKDENEVRNGHTLTRLSFSEFVNELDLKTRGISIWKTKNILNNSGLNAKKSKRVMKLLTKFGLVNLQHFAGTQWWQTIKKTFLTLMVVHHQIQYLIYLGRNEKSVFFGAQNLRKRPILRSLIFLYFFTQPNF